MNRQEISEYLKVFGHSELNELQKKAIPFLDEHPDSLIVSPTGSGKTLCFLLAALPHINHQSNEAIQLLIVVPTRELALQIDHVFRQLKTGYKLSTCYGGHSVLVETRSLESPPTVLIATPGRLVDHMQRGNVDLKQVHTLILDEFDKSLEMGFHEDMETIVQALNTVQRNWLFSATQAVELPQFMRSTDFAPLVHLADNKGAKRYFALNQVSGKRQRLRQLLASLSPEQAIVFCNQKDTCDSLHRELRDEDVDCVVFHGGLQQDRRELSLVAFRNGSAQVLISTDLAARGLDIPKMKHVIHYDVPESEDAFIHRSGRTARVDENGSVYIIPKQSEWPDFIPEADEFSLENRGPNNASEWTTIYISGGKKNKINKIDLVGFFLQVGRLEKDELGLIEVKDYKSYVAVKRNRAKQLLALCRGQKIKKQKLKIEIARI